MIDANEIFSRCGDIGIDERCLAELCMTGGKLHFPTRPAANAAIGYIADGLSELPDWALELWKQMPPRKIDDMTARELDDLARLAWHCCCDAKVRHTRLFSVGDPDSAKATADALAALRGARLLSIVPHEVDADDRLCGAALLFLTENENDLFFLDCGTPVIAAVDQDGERRENEHGEPLFEHASGEDLFNVLIVGPMCYESGEAAE